MSQLHRTTFGFYAVIDWVDSSTSMPRSHEVTWFSAPTGLGEKRKHGVFAMPSTGRQPGRAPADDVRGLVVSFASITAGS
jgi:hypothetical protein